MYQEQLKKDLKTIFKVPRVDVGRAVETCIEQNVLCVDIERAKIQAKDGVIFARVSGYVGIRATEQENKNGYLIKKINEAPELLVSRFWFSPQEEQAAFSPAEFELKGYKVRFTYFYSSQYNLPQGTLEDATWHVVVNRVKQAIINFFKS